MALPPRGRASSASFSLILSLLLSHPPRKWRIAIERALRRESKGHARGERRRSKERLDPPRRKNVRQRSPRRNKSRKTGVVADDLFFLFRTGAATNFLVKFSRFLFASAKKKPNASLCRKEEERRDLQGGLRERRRNDWLHGCSRLFCRGDRSLSLSRSLGAPLSSCTKSRAFPSRECPKKSHCDPEQAAEQQERAAGRAERGEAGPRTLTGLKLLFFFRRRARNKMPRLKRHFPRFLSQRNERTCGGSEGPPSASNSSARRRARGDGAAGKGHLGDAGEGKGRKKEKTRERAGLKVEN